MHASPIYCDIVDKPVKYGANRDPWSHQKRLTSCFVDGDHHGCNGDPQGSIVYATTTTTYTSDK